MVVSACWWAAGTAGARFLLRVRAGVGVGSGLSGVGGRGWCSQARCAPASLCHARCVITLTPTVTLTPALTLTLTRALKVAMAPSSGGLARHFALVNTRYSGQGGASDGHYVAVAFEIEHSHHWQPA